MNNPNRFIHGLTDIGQIFDDQVNPTPVVVVGPDNKPVIIPNLQRSLDTDIEDNQT